MLALLGDHLIFHISGLRVNVGSEPWWGTDICHIQYCRLCFESR